MRLTLRTLLAYLDDTLPADKAREIGQKVAESPVAQELIERIKKVTRRRSLANPPVHGESSKLDPNAVAEYIDGELSPEEVEQVDMTCLSEDVYLAEVAACHQILTLMLSEPARVPPAARQRMYRLVKGPESIHYKPPPIQPSLDDAPDREDEEHRPVRWPWYVLALLAAGIGLAASIWLAWPKDRRSGAATQIALAPPTAPAPEVPTSKKASEPDKSKEPVRAVLDPKPPEKKEPEKKVPDKKEPETKAPDKKDLPPLKPESKPDMPPPRLKKPIDAPPATAPSAVRRDIGQFISANSVLLQQPAEAPAGWQRLLPKAPIRSNMVLLSLPAFRGEVKLDSGVHALLWGSVPEFQGPPTFESSVTFYAAAPPFDADLMLHRGRIVLQNKRAGSAAQIRLRFQNEIWDLEVAENSEVIVDMEISHAPGTRFSKDAGGEEPSARIYLGVPKGKLSIRIGFQKPLDLAAPPGAALVGWDNKAAVREVVRIKETLPSWSPVLPDVPSAREMVKARDELVQRFLKRDASPEVLLTEFGQEATPTFQVLSVFGLGAINALPELIDAMDDAERPIVRGAAIFALRHWCAREPENDLRLHRVLIEKKNFTEGQADIVLQLVHLFSDVDLQQPSTYTALFAYMNHERLAIRELAFSHLVQIDPDGARLALYNPAGSDEERDAAIARWRKRIPPGKIPPKPANAPRTP